MHKVTLVGIAVLFAAANAYSGNRIHFNDIRALTFRKGAYSTSRRLAPVPQLKCVGGPCREFDINTIQCRNIGHDGQLPQWECKTPDLSNRVQIGTNEVVCEGYERAGDPYILHGSCGLEYSLKRTDNYQQRTPNPVSYGHKYSPSGGYGLFGVFLTIAGFTFLFRILMSVFDCTAEAQGGSAYGRPDVSYGGHGNTYCQPGVSYGRYSNYGHYGRSNHRPGGFWTGAGLGGLAGYWAGRSSRRAYPSYHQHTSPGWGSSSRWHSSSTTNHGSRTATSFAGSRSR